MKSREGESEHEVHHVSAAADSRESHRTQSREGEGTPMPRGCPTIHTKAHPKSHGKGGK